jgi:hypothetical protein
MSTPHFCVWSARACGSVKMLAWCIHTAYEIVEVYTHLKVCVEKGVTCSQTSEGHHIPTNEQAGTTLGNRSALVAVPR